MCGWMYQSGQIAELAEQMLLLLIAQCIKPGILVGSTMRAFGRLQEEVSRGRYQKAGNEATYGRSDQCSEHVSRVYRATVSMGRAAGGPATWRRNFKIRLRNHKSNIFSPEYVAPLA